MVSELWNTHIRNIPQQMASEVRQNNDQTMTKTMTGNEMTNDQTMTKTMTGNEMTNDRTMTKTMTGNEMTNDGEQNDQINFSGKYK
jgi:hypothetical protein